MKNAVIIHGTCSKEEYLSDKYPSLSNSHWLPWLQKQLLINGIHTQTPEMPGVLNLNYESWKNELEKNDIGSESILIGHSTGGGFLARWLSENKVKIHKLILVAPWLDPNCEETTTFFDFSFPGDILERADEIHLLVSRDDNDDILESVRIIREGIPGISYHEFADYGHFITKHMKTERFPELLTLAIN